MFPVLIGWQGLSMNDECLGSVVSRYLQLSLCSPQVEKHSKVSSYQIWIFSLTFAFSVVEIYSRDALVYVFPYEN